MKPPSTPTNRNTRETVPCAEHSVGGRQARQQAYNQASGDVDCQHTIGKYRGWRQELPDSQVQQIPGNRAEETARSN